MLRRKIFLRTLTALLIVAGLLSVAIVGAAVQTFDGQGQWQTIDDEASRLQWLTVEKFSPAQMTRGFFFAIITEKSFGGHAMLVVNNATELFNPIHMVNSIPSTAFIKEHNMKIWNTVCNMHFVELGNYTCYTFKHPYSGDLIGIIRKLFKTDDVDLGLYLIIHTYHKAIANGEDGLAAVLTHPIYPLLVNVEQFDLEIGQWHNVPIFSPFVKEKPQNLFTRITPPKLVKAILAGQIEKVICNGNYTDNYCLDQKNNNWRGEWDIFDFADEIYGHDTKFYGISRRENTIHVFSYAGEWHEDYTVYIKNGY